MPAQRERYALFDRLTGRIVAWELTSRDAKVHAARLNREAGTERFVTFSRKRALAEVAARTP